MIKNLLLAPGEALTAEVRDSLPDCFTNPFSYIPHSLCREAMEDVCLYLGTHKSIWGEELQREGKMFGVLVVESPEYKIGYLSAYSGVLEGGQDYGFFVPPVYDLISAESFFLAEEAEISKLNDFIADLEQDRFMRVYWQVTQELKEEHRKRIAELEAEYEDGKARRDILRSSGNVSEVELAALVRESQFQKGEIRRAIKRMKEEVGPREKGYEEYLQRIEEVKRERKEKSAALQRKIFDHFSFLNARGETKSLIDIFDGVVPPAGAGECAAPRLLQYAYLHGYRPIAMGEFWYGASKLERKAYEFYPSCKGKCGPILGHMLQGLKVDSSSFHSSYGCDFFPDGFSPEIIFEDEWLLAVNKPAGVLSVPGKDSREKSLLQMLCKMDGAGDASGSCASGSCTPASGVSASALGDSGGNLFVVHRLDMHTSGILLIAKSEKVYKELQKQFLARKVEKCYVSVLDGEVGRGAGTISLPLAADYVNRPLQCVDFEHGKPALTRYEVVAVSGGKSFVKFWPVTGRTHQLRVHAAHPQGLNAPIEGDLLYGKLSGRLMLHAHTIKFYHPVSGAVMELSATVPPQMEPQMWK